MGNTDPQALNRLGRAIAGMRHRAGLTQTELAKAIGASTNKISDLEIGKRKRIPKRSDLEDIERVLDGDGELLRIAGYTPADDLPEDYASAIIEATKRLTATVYAVGDQLYVVPTTEQLKKLGDEELVTLARRSLSAMQDRAEPNIQLVVKSIAEQLRNLGTQVGTR